VRAEHDEAIVYFCIRERDRLVGQIMLHDIDRDAGVALVGYHIFSAADRGRGIGTRALSLLCEFTARETALLRIVAITGVENIASQRIAMKCGFRKLGPAREGAHLVVYERQTSD
jgi:ribosomal-protein-serine acetyltransferase